MLNKIVIIDGHALAYKIIYGIVNSKNQNDDIYIFDFWNYLMYCNLFSILDKFTPNKFIIVFDSLNSWRYDYYSDYKANRHTSKKKYNFDYQEFTNTIKNFITNLKNLFTKFYVLQIDKTEGDDIIAVITKYHCNDSKIIIISNDSDFIQLLGKNVELYDPRKKTYIKSISPKNELNIKILKGDEGDNIPPIKKGIGIVHATKIINSGLESYLESLSASDQQLMLDNYNRNKILINFEFIPQDLQRNILKQYQNYNIKNVDGKGIVKMFIKLGNISILSMLNTHVERMNNLI